MGLGSQVMRLTLSDQERAPAGLPGVQLLDVPEVEQVPMVAPHHEWLDGPSSQFLYSFLQC